MSSRFKFWTKAAHAALFMVILMSMMMIVYIGGPVIETRLFPVFSKFKIVSAVEIDPGSTQVVVEFTKLRECEPGGFAWYRGWRGGNVEELVVKAIITTPNGRPTGKQISQPFVVNATPTEIERFVFAEVYSRCHPFWMTRSDVYP